MSKFFYLAAIMLFLLSQIACGNSAIQSDLLSRSQDSNSGRTQDPIGVAVSPQTFILSVEQGNNVTVHTSIPISLVNTASLKLNDVPASSIGVDSLGHIVGNFNESAIEATVAPPSAIMTLTGLYKTGGPFTGFDTVRVIE